MKTLSAEMKARKTLLIALEQAEAFYHNQRSEVKVVANAYRNFGNRIRTMKRKVDELIEQLPSPVPSPDINAPSPEPDNDFELPEPKNFDQVCVKIYYLLKYILGNISLALCRNTYN